MDFVNKFTGGSDSKSHGQQSHGGGQSSGGGIGDKFNNMAGGGAKGEKNEDLLDKGERTSSVFEPSPI